VTNIQFEQDLLDKNIQYIAGVDEVGRGCLAGPMVVAAVILNAADLCKLANNDVTDLETVQTEEFQKYTQINDSKLINPNKRSELSKFIQSVSTCYSIEIIEPQLIDKFGISQVTQIGFYNAIQKLSTKPDYILTDAFKIKKYPEQIQTNIIKGDRKSISIGAASIIAKVFRDNLMCQLHQNPIYEPYCFNQHKGYGTKLHMAMLKKHGPCSIHRRSFDPIKSVLQ